MSHDLVQAQLLLLLSQQPERLGSRKVTEDLFSSANAEVFKALRSLFIEGQETTLSAASMRPGLSPEALVTIEKLKGYGPPEISMDQAIDFLKEWVLRKVFSDRVRSAYDEGHDRSIPINQTISGLMAGMASLTATGSDFLQAGSDFKAVEEALEWRSRNPGVLRGPSTGFMRLDRRLDGFTPKYRVIGARPSVGKSALVGNFSEAECEVGGKCLIYSIEMPADEYRERVLSQVSGVSLSGHRQTQLSTLELKAIFTAQRKIKQWSWWINDNQDITIDEIEAEVTAMVNKHGRIHVFIDYLQLVAVKSKANRNEQVAEISNRCKKLQRRLNIPVTVCAQLRRQEAYFDKERKRTVNPEPRLEDLRESGSIEQDADCVMLLHRDLIEDTDKAKLILAKNRSGSTDAGIELDYFSSTLRFKETPK